jgi:hypothetical protein
MTEKTREKELDELKADIASLREEIAALAAGVKKFTETKGAEPHAEGEYETTRQGGPGNGGHGHGACTDFQHTLDEAWAQGEKAVKDLAAEIERHPLAGSMAAFGFGFIIAKLWYRGSKP